MSNLKEYLEETYISKEKVKEKLGVEDDISNDNLLSLIETIVAENNRLEDTEDKKVQLEYANIFNKGVESVRDKIKENLKLCKKVYEDQMKPYQREYGLDVTYLTKKEKEQLINKRNCLLTQIKVYEMLLEQL